MAWNVFRYLADTCHILSKTILIYIIHANSSAEGVSLITQIEYLIVFLARYLPFPFWPKTDNIDDVTTWHKIWNLTGKVTYILTSAYTIFLMTKVFARTKEKEVATKAAWGSAGFMLLISPFVMLIFMPKRSWLFSEWSWTFSITLESVAVIPQLLLLRQTNVPTVLDSFYLVMLGLYRFFYLLNWTVKGLTAPDISNAPGFWDPIPIIFGIIQTLFYIDFAWVYWSRQRVKLRGGALVDSDDFRNGWLVKRLMKKPRQYEAVDEEYGPAVNHGSDEHVGHKTRSANNKWGPRGISVSADEGVHEAQGELDDPAAFEDEDLPGYADDAPGQKSNESSAKRTTDGSER